MHPARSDSRVGPYGLRRILLLLVLLYAQAAVLMHAVQHPFHHGDAHCAIYKLAENHGHALPTIDFALAVTSIGLTPIVSVEHVYFRPHLLRATARAPPSLPSLSGTA